MTTWHKVITTNKKMQHVLWISISMYVHCCFVSMFVNFLYLSRLNLCSRKCKSCSPISCRVRDFQATLHFDCGNVFYYFESSDESSSKRCRVFIRRRYVDRVIFLALLHSPSSLYQCCRLATEGAAYRLLPEGETVEGFVGLSVRPA